MLANGVILVVIPNPSLYAMTVGNLISCQVEDCNCDHNVATVKVHGTGNVTISDPDGCIYVTLDRSGKQVSST